MLAMIGLGSFKVIKIQPLDRSFAFAFCHCKYSSSAFVAV